jgi:hypothetical protein
VIRGGEEEASAGGGLELGVAMELGSVVGRDGSHGERSLGDQGEGGPVEFGDGSSPQLSDHDVAGRALDK